MGNNSWGQTPISCARGLMTKSASLIPVQIIGGYLGSGKTTLLNSILNSASEPIAVVVNDFGAINIDASVISAVHEDVIELSNGCICCAVGTSLADVLFNILDRDPLPSLILIEASGVADPAGVAAFTHLAGLYNAGVVVLVDAVQAITTMNDKFVGPVFSLQIAGADLLAITKSDLVEEKEIQQLIAIVNTQAPTTPVVVSGPQILCEILSVKDPEITPQNHQNIFSSRLIDEVLFDSELAIRSFIAELGPQVVRVKGIVGLKNKEHRLIQVVGQHLAITKTSLATTGLIEISVRS